MTRLARYYKHVPLYGLLEDEQIVRRLRRQRRLQALARGSWKVYGVGRFRTSGAAGRALDIAQQNIVKAAQRGHQVRGHRVRWAGHRWPELGEIIRNAALAARKPKTLRAAGRPTLPLYSDRGDCWASMDECVQALGCSYRAVRTAMAEGLLLHGPRISRKPFPVEVAS